MTRGHGVIEPAARLIPLGHLGLGFADSGEFFGCAAEYIADGLDQNQLVKYVGAGDRKALRAELESMPGIGDRFDVGEIKVSSTHDCYAFCPGTDVVDPEASVAKYVWAAENAIARGYTGFRAVVDVTPVARRREQRDALARLEYLVDQEMAVRPVSALCAYNVTQLGATAAELICLHPFATQGVSTFQVYAEREVECALTGEIDAASEELFTMTLRRIWPRPADETVVIDAGGLEFIDHRQLRNLDHYAHSAGRQVILCTDQHIVVRLAGLLDLTNVTVQARSDEPTR